MNPRPTPPDGWQLHYRELSSQWWTRVEHLLFETPFAALNAGQRYFLGRRYGYQFIVALRVVPSDFQQYEDNFGGLRAMRYYPGSEHLIWPRDEWR